MSRRLSGLFAASGLALTVAAAALAALEEKSKAIEGRGVRFEVPASWKSETVPGQGFRVAQVKLDPAEGDREPAELIVYVFNGDGGGVDANLKRWRGMFRDAEDREPMLESAKRKGKNVDVTIAEVAGRYVAAVRPGSPETHNKPGFRLLGAIVLAPERSYYFKMVGPDRTVKAAKPGFDQMVKSIVVEDR